MVQTYMACLTLSIPPAFLFLLLDLHVVPFLTPGVKYSSHKITIIYFHANKLQLLCQPGRQAKEYKKDSLEIV